MAMTEALTSLGEWKCTSILRLAAASAITPPACAVAARLLAPSAARCDTRCVANRSAESCHYATGVARNAKLHRRKGQLTRDNGPADTLEVGCEEAANVQFCRLLTLLINSLMHSFS